MNGSVRPSVRLSVCPSVRLSVCHTFLTMFPSSYHHKIFVITSDRSDVHAKGQGQRSKVKVTEVTTQLYRFRTVTPVWIHVWWWNDAYSLIMLRRGALLFFKVICQISMLHKAWNSKEEMPYCFPRSSIKFQGHTGQNITDFDPNWAFPNYRPVAAFKSLRFALLSCDI